MAAQKTTAKPTGKRPAKIPQKHGGALNSGGTPGNRGGPGRPPDAFKELCRQLASGEKTIANVREILANPDHAQFLPALRWATEHGYGKPKESHELEVGDKLADLITASLSR